MDAGQVFHEAQLEVGRQESSTKMFGTGETSAVNGVTVGTYLFRNVSQASAE